MPVEVQTSDSAVSKGSNHQASFAQSDVQDASVASFAYSILVADNVINQSGICYVSDQTLVRSTSTKSYRRLIASWLHIEEQG